MYVFRGIEEEQNDGRRANENCRNTLVHNNKFYVSSIHWNPNYGGLDELTFKNEIINSISNNDLKENDMLPSIRNLAKDLRISILTVKKPMMN